MSDGGPQRTARLACVISRRLSSVSPRCMKGEEHVYWQGRMRTNIVLDDELVAEAMRRTGIKTKRAVVEEALRTLIGLKRQEEILALRGKLHWEGDLDQMRRD
jgi:Arc/MetJ family transcription regulator